MGTGDAGSMLLDSCVWGLSLIMVVIVGQLIATTDVDQKLQSDKLQSSKIVYYYIKLVIVVRLN